MLIAICNNPKSKGKEVVFMNLVDVVSITKQGISQLIGANYYDAETPELTETDVTALAELGHSLENHAAAADIFLGALIDVLATMRIDSRAYSAVLPSLFVDTNEWGGFREHVLVGLSDILNDEMYPLNGFINYNETGGDDEAVRIAGLEHGTFKPPVNAKFYDEGKPFMIALSTVREQLFTAVRSLAELNKLISAMKISVDNTIQLKAEVGAMYTVCTGISRAIALGNEIPLVTLYNATRTQGGIITTGGFELVSIEPADWSTDYASYYTKDATGDYVANVESTFANVTNGVYKKIESNTATSAVLPTGEQALNDPAFVAFALETIANTKEEFRRFTAVYNNHQHVTFSNDSRLILLAKFANRAKFGVRANTFNEQLLGIGDYDKVSGWQAINASGKNPFALDTLSSISLTKAAAVKVGFDMGEGDDGLTLTNIIGCLYDRYAMGVSLEKKKVTTSYTATQDKWNTYHHDLINYIIDDNFPIIAFTLN